MKSHAIRQGGRARRLRVERLLVALVLIPLASAAPTAMAQGDSPTVTLLAVDNSAFPLLTLRLSVVNAAGRPVRGLTPASVEVLEDGRAAEVVSVTEAIDEAQGIAVVLVIDVSDSMAGAPLAAARESAAAFVDTLGPNDQVAILSFARSVREVQSFTSDRALARAAIEKLQTGGVTALYDAANQGVLTAGNAGLTRRVVILLSDGAEYGGASLSSPEEAYEAAQANGVVIHTIALGFNADTAYLQKLSGLTGGVALTAPTADELNARWQEIAALMRQVTEVVVRSRAGGEGVSHSLLLRVTVGGQTAEAGGTFFSRAVAPTVVVAGLQTGETLDAERVVGASVKAQGEILRVTFSVDGVLIARDETRPWEAALNPRDFTPGAHELEVVATDASGLSGATTMAFAVPPLAPTVTLDLAEGQVLDQPLSLTPHIQAQGGLAQVTVAVDGETVAVLTAEPYRFVLDPARFSRGAHTLTVSAADSGGLTGSFEAGFTAAGAAWFIPTPVVIAVVVVIGLLAFGGTLIAVRRGGRAGRERAALGPHLRVVIGLEKGEIFAITKKAQVIGRGSTAAIRLSDPTGALHLSREHARVWREGETVYIEDAGSHYGVQVNGVRITARTALENGARIRLGEVELVFAHPSRAEDLRETGLAAEPAMAGYEAAQVERGEARRTKRKPAARSAEADESRRTAVKPAEADSPPLDTLPESHAAAGASVEQEAAAGEAESRRTRRKEA